VRSLIDANLDRAANREGLRGRRLVPFPPGSPDLVRAARTCASAGSLPPMPPSYKHASPQSASRWRAGLHTPPAASARPQKQVVAANARRVQSPCGAGGIGRTATPCWPPRRQLRLFPLRLGAELLATLAAGEQLRRQLQSEQLIRSPILRMRAAQLRSHGGRSPERRGRLR